MSIDGENGILKENHNLTRTIKMGIANVLEQCLLTALVLNMKRYIKALRIKELKKRIVCLTTRFLIRAGKWLGNISPKVELVNIYHVTIT